MDIYRVEIKWALIFTVMGLLWMVMEKSLGWHDEHIDKHASYTMLFMIPAVMVYYFAIRDKRQTDFAGSMTWKQGFISGAILSLIVAILAIPSQWITNTVITPDYFDNVVNYMVENEMATREEAEAQFNPQNYLIQAPIFSFVVGLVTAAVVSLLLKRK
jgi:hypothetical protein